MVIDQVYCHGLPQIMNYIASLDGPLQRVVMTGVFRCICRTKEHHGDLRHVDDDPSVRGCLDNFAGTWQASVGWRNVKRVDANSKWRKGVWMSFIRRPKRHSARMLRIIDWLIGRTSEVCESWHLYGGVHENSFLGHDAAPPSNRSMTFWRTVHSSSHV